MPSNRLPTGTVSYHRGDRTRPTDTGSTLDPDADSRPRVESGPQLLYARDGGSQSTRGAPRRPERDPDADARIADLEEQVEALERELARREADHREIIHRYEHVLAETHSPPSGHTDAAETLAERVAGFVDRHEQRLGRLGRRETTEERRQRDDRPLRERLGQLLPWR